MNTLSLFPDEAMATVERPSSVSRASNVYGVHSYHTKVPPEAIERFIARHTDPGQIVLDPFCGSGMTGVAARRLGRSALLSDLSPAAVHIARNYTETCSPADYQAAVARVERRLEVERHLYAMDCRRCGGEATLAYGIWSDVRSCPSCDAPIVLWDQRSAGLRRLGCPECGESFQKRAGRLLREKLVSLSVSCEACGRYEAAAMEEDEHASRVERPSIPYWVPDVPFGADRPMWRAGHEELGIRSVADFYSGRNLRALAAIWDAIHQETDVRIVSALEFTFTAIANRASRRYQWNAKRPTNVLGGTLYVSSIRYEFNVFGLWARKVAAVRRFLGATNGVGGSAAVVLASATDLPYDSGSIDYCFSDPPFGANIIYSDCSLLWEAWLGQLTDVTQEAVMDGNGRGLVEYGDLMGRSFREIHRVLKAGAAATIVFQNTDPLVWEALLEAAVNAGFGVENVEVLHKAQPSFKGIKADQEGERVAASDVVLTLRRDGGSIRVRAHSTGFVPIWEEVTAELSRKDLSRRQRTSGHLFAVAVAAAMRRGMPASSATFDELEDWLSAHCEQTASGWQLVEHASVV